MEKEILINPGIMTLVSFVAMYLLLCTMIDGQRFLNQYRSTLNAGNDDDRDGRHSIDHNGGAMYKNAMVRNTLFASSIP